MRKGKKDYRGRIKTAKDTKDESGPKKSDIIKGMSEKQKTEALMIVSGATKAAPTTEKVKQFFLSEAEGASRRMIELSRQDTNLNVAYNATKDILDRAGIRTNQADNDGISNLIGVDEAVLIMKRRIPQLSIQE